MPVLGRFLKGCRQALLAPAEDPRLRWEDAGRRQQRLVEQVRRSIARVELTTTQVADRRAGLLALNAALEEQARQAVSVGNDDLARAILRRQQHARAELVLLENHLRDLRHQAQRLTVAELQITAQIDALTVRQELTAARLSAAEARAGIDLTNELPDIDTALNHLDARATALDELTDAGIFGIAAPDFNDAAIEARLARLKLHADE